MARRRYTPVTIIRELHDAEVLQGQGKTVAETVKLTATAHEHEDGLHRAGQPVGERLLRVIQWPIAG